MRRIIAHGGLDWMESNRGTWVEVSEEHLTAAIRARLVLREPCDICSTRCREGQVWHAGGALGAEDGENWQQYLDWARDWVEPAYFEVVEVQEES